MSKRIGSKWSEVEGLAPCPFCGSPLLAHRIANVSGHAWTFSCSNRACLLWRERNLLRIPEWADVNEDEAIRLINQRATGPVTAE